MTIFTAAYRARFPQLASQVDLRWVPQFVPTIHFLTGVQLARPWQRADTALYDHLVAMRIAATRDRFDIFWALGVGALASGRAARRRGARFVLDRACPHVDAQQALIRDGVRTPGCALSGRAVLVPRPSTCRIRRGGHHSGALGVLSRNIPDWRCSRRRWSLHSLDECRCRRSPISANTTSASIKGREHRIECAVHLRHSRRTAFAQRVFISAAGMEATPASQCSTAAAHRCAARSFAGTARIAA